MHAERIAVTHRGASRAMRRMRKSNAHLVLRVVTLCVHDNDWGMLHYCRTVIMTRERGERQSSGSHIRKYGANRIKTRTKLTRYDKLIR